MSDYTHHPLEYDRYFHIYNRGINGTKLFRNTANCELFLKKYTDYINPVAETFAWALIVNHFHFW
jgi:putative transposase